MTLLKGVLKTSANPVAPKCHSVSWFYEAFICSFNKYLLSIYYVLGFILRYNTVDKSKTDKTSALVELPF